MIYTGGFNPLYEVTPLSWWSWCYKKAVLTSHGEQVSEQYPSTVSASVPALVSCSDGLWPEGKWKQTLAFPSCFWSFFFYHINRDLNIDYHVAVLFLLYSTTLGNLLIPILKVYFCSFVGWENSICFIAELGNHLR